METNERHTLEMLSKLDTLLGNSARLKLVWLLAREPSMDYLSLMRLSGLSSGNITTHIQKLLRAKYVEQTKRFVDNRPRTTLRLTAQGKAAYEDWGRRIVFALPESVKNDLLPGFRENPPLWPQITRQWDADGQNRYSFINLDKGLNLWPPATWSSQ